MNKLIISLMLVMVCLSFISAEQDSLGTYTKGQDIELLQICGTCSYNNITSIVYPNSSHQTIDAAMTKRGMEYTHTLTDTNQIGTYSVNGFGDLDGTAEAWAYDLEVTGSGRGGVDVIWILVIVMVLSIGLIAYGFIQEEHPPITIGAILLLVTALYIWINGFGILGAKDLISQFIAAALFIVGATLTIKSLGGD